MNRNNKYYNNGLVFYGTSTSTDNYPGLNPKHTKASVFLGIATDVQFVILFFFLSLCWCQNAEVLNNMGVPVGRSTIAQVWSVGRSFVDR